MKSPTSPSIGAMPSDERGNVTCPILKPPDSRARYNKVHCTVLYASDPLLRVNSNSLFGQEHAVPSLPAVVVTSSSPAI